MIRQRRLLVTVAILATMVFPQWPGNASARDLFPRRCCCPQYSTTLRQGALTVDITGPQYNIVEAYFNDRVYRTEFAHTTNLHLGRVLLSPGNEGAFAVRYGAGNANIRFIAWKNGIAEIRESSARPVAVLLPGDGPIIAEWKTSAVLRLSRFNCGVNNVCMIRWQESTKDWQYADDSGAFLNIPR